MEMNSYKTSPTRVHGRNKVSVRDKWKRGERLKRTGVRRLSGTFSIASTHTPGAASETEAVGVLEPSGKVVTAAVEEGERVDIVA